ncbi:MAG: TIGR01620 family protein [Pseudomonadota bacterium]
MEKGPVLIELEGPEPSVLDAPDVEPAPEFAAGGNAMQSVARVTGRQPSRLAIWFWRLAGALLVTVVGIAAWDFAAGLVARNIALGWTVTALMAAVSVVSLLLVLRELAALGRLARVDGLKRRADAARAGGDLGHAREAVAALSTLYANRGELSEGRARLDALQGDQLDSDGLMKLAEETLLVPLDHLASREIEAAARQVATVTALVPLALADVLAALVANLRMIRRVAEIYGGRGGVLGGWRLTRSVMAHLVATGAVAIGDDLLEPVLGGTVLGKLSRRFGEGLVNGALTVRVGVATMDVCRPLSFGEGTRPKVRDIVGRSLSGLMGASTKQRV